MNPNKNLEKILESAVVISWADLTRGNPTGLIHIEYGFQQAELLTISSSGHPSPEVIGFWPVSIGWQQTRITARALVLKMDISPKV